MCRVHTMSKHITRWGSIALLILSAVAMAGPNNYIGIDADGNVYELNYGANSGSLNIDEGSHYETYSTSGTDIIYFDLATQAELDAIELTPGETGATGATGSTGSQGETGSSGSSGSDGAAGSDGGTGAQGPRGERGQAGDDFNGDARLVSLETGFNNLYDYKPDIGANTLGIVGVAAINGIRFPERDGLYLGIGTGYYRGQSAIAIGVSKRKDNVSINFNVSSTGVASAGIVWRFGD